MKTPEFARWCALAVEDIKYKPDRNRVYDELYAHLEDRCAAMTEAGVPEREAVKQALAAMGSAAEAAEQLEKIHRPFWGYFLLTARWLLLFAAVLALLTVPRWLRDQDYSSDKGLFSAVWFGQDAMDNGSLHGERLFYTRPMARDRSDGYFFTLTDAAEWHETGSIEGREIDTLSFYLSVEAFNLRPWAQYSDILREFYAVDSLGNRYEAMHLCPSGGETPSLVGNPTRTGLFTVTWGLWLRDYRSHGAEWIELRYDRSGRDVRLRIDLTGGDAA